jgi:hypothetical protein
VLGWPRTEILLSLAPEYVGLWACITISGLVLLFIGGGDGGMVVKDLRHSIL